MLYTAQIHVHNSAAAQLASSCLDRNIDGIIITALSALPEAALCSRFTPGSAVPGRCLFVLMEHRDEGCSVRQLPDSNYTRIRDHEDVHPAACVVQPQRRHDSAFLRGAQARLIG